MNEKKVRYYTEVMLVVFAVGMLFWVSWVFDVADTASIRITGFATAVNGSINVTVVSASSMVFTDAAIGFGTGYVNSSFTNCTLDTTSLVNASLGCIGFSSETTGLAIENTGNTNLTIAIVFNSTAAQFIGGTNPAVLYKVTTEETGSCVNLDGSSTTPVPSDWTEVNTSAPGTTVCPKLIFNNSKDSLRIDLRLRIPSDASNIKNAYFTVTGSVAD